MGRGPPVQPGPLPSAARISATHLSEIRSSSLRLGHTARKASYCVLACALFCAAVVAICSSPAGVLRTFRCLLPVGKLPLDSTGMASTSLPGGTWPLGDLTVTRFGYGAMQLAGPWVMGPPADH